jgi:hypothetical protein
MDYGEALVVLEGCVKRLKDTLPRGRWVESMEVSILAEQHLRALVEECKRQDRLAHAPADHSPRLAYKPEERSTKVVFAHFHYPDEG